MAKALSTNLRRRVVDATAQGMSCRQAAERFGVSASSAIRWQQRVRTTGTIEPRTQGGDRRSKRIEAHSQVILGPTRSRWPSPSSKPCYAPLPRGQFRSSTTPSNSSPQTNAEITSLPPYTMPSDRKTL
jgi:transposase-like protein